MLSPAEDECFANMPHDFLICTTVHKARGTGIFTGHLYVRVTFDKTRRHTRVFSQSENPFFNEYFVFEMKCTLSELLRATILYEMRRQSKCKKRTTIGELPIDMQSVWNQPNRCYFKKWGRLEPPLGTAAKGAANVDPGANQARSFLQIDLAIVSQTSNPGSIMRPYEGDTTTLNKWQIHHDYDDIEKNLLQSLDPSIHCNILYVVSFFRGYFVQKGDYCVQFRFNPFKGKTSVQKATSRPVWNEAMTFAWTFPSLAQTLVVQVLSHEHLQWKVVAEYDLHFDDIAFNAKPALGPAFIHLYDPESPSKYLGRLLIQIHSESVERTIRRDLVNAVISPIDEQRFWHLANFQIEFVALQGDFLRGNISNCKITLKLAEATSNQVECFLKPYGGHRQRLNSLKYFRQEAPFKAISLLTIQPDNRNKFESDFFMQEVLDYIKTEIETFKLFQLKYSNQYQVQIKCLKAIILAVMSKIREGLNAMRLEYRGLLESTVWDTNRLMYLQEFFKRFQEVLRQLRMRLKNTHTHHIGNSIEAVLQDLVRYSNELATLMSTTRVQDDWPDLLIVLSAPGNKEVGVSRLNAKHYLNARDEEAESCKNFCWQMRNFVFKDKRCQHTCAHCGCTVAIVQGCLGIVEADKERDEYIQRNLSSHWSQPEALYWSPVIPHSMFRCRFFIHSAKVRPGGDRTGLCDTYVRVIFGAHYAETPTEQATLSPIWNTVVAFERVVLAGPPRWYMKHPPLVAVELYDMDKHTSHDYLGCGILAASVVGPSAAAAGADEEQEGHMHLSDLVRTKNAFLKFQKLKTLSPPPLKWIPIAHDGCVRAEVLMSAELVEGPTESAEDKWTDIVPTISTGIPSTIRPTMRNFVLEVIFAGFRNYTRSTLINKHRIKVMMGELILMSGLSATRQKNSINFLVIYASGVVSLPEQLEYWPAIIVQDVAVCRGSSESTVGAALISNSRRFLQRNRHTQCLPRITFDRAPSITSTVVTMDEDEQNEAKSLLTKDGAKGLLTQFVNMVCNCNFGDGRPKRSFNMPHVGFEDDPKFNWWTKFYNSLFTDASALHNFKHTLTIYTNELERQPEFSYLTDWAEPVPIAHGMKFKKSAPCQEQVYATLKLQLKITQCVCNSPGADGGGDTGDCGDTAALRPLTSALNPKYQAKIQQISESCKVVVRVYIVQGLQFRPHNRNSQSDAYVRLHLGNRTASNRALYVPNQSNPVFGHCFQMEGTLPKEHTLEITVFDRNSLSDEVIGSTHVDLEDRWRTRHRATVGIANEYSITGYNKWHDIQTPYQILNDFCAEYDMAEPVYKGRTIEFDGVSFSGDFNNVVDLQEQLSLVVLKNFDRLPHFGYKLIPEHVETRSLYRQDCPGIEQGKIQLWIEMYEANMNLPEPLDITPEPPKLYEVRLIIYNCMDVVLDDKNIFGKHMSDIFVKGWCSDPNQAQATDIHYRSLNGEANFNWRMIFPIKYSAVDGMMVAKRKGGLFGDYEMKCPPIIYIQVWDNDLVSADDFLGMIEINIANFAQPFEQAKPCTLSGYENRKSVNLFTAKQLRGWFPLRGHPQQAGTKATLKKISEVLKGMTGKIELELQILTDSEATADPVGLARSPPNALPVPARPATSFNPLMNPMKTFQKILLPVLLKCFFICVAFFIVVLVIVAVVYFIPIMLAKFATGGYYYYS